MLFSVLSEEFIADDRLRPTVIIGHHRSHTLPSGATFKFKVIIANDFSWHISLSQYLLNRSHSGGLTFLLRISVDKR